MAVAEHQGADRGKSRTVTSVATDHSARAIATIALAFTSDPMMRWSFPDPARYMEIVPGFLHAFSGDSFAQGAVDQVGDFAAVAIWLPPGFAPDGETMGTIIRANMPADRLADGGRVMEQMERFHPKEPHWYLPLIGADPAHQGKGHGSALLEHAMKRCDRDHLPAYLESSNPVNVPLYERFGFKVMGTIQEGSSPPLTPMLRPAR
jgi:ribosomal protein S18 acetylase RimI-like enzyme